MENFHLSLALFTWLTQASVGLLVMRTLYMSLLAGSNRKEIYGQYMLFAALVMLVTGLFFSFSHLNYPRHAYNAINNLGSSWMSREILAEVILLTLLLLWYIINKFRIKIIPQPVFETPVLITGFLLLYFMIRTYMLPALDELRHPSFALSFIITALLAGSATTWLLIKKTEKGAGLKFKMLFTVLFIASFINYLIFRSFNNDIRLLDIYSLLYLAAIILSFLSLSATIKNKNGISDVIFLTLALISDFLFRVYTLTYANPSL
jgi:anaerobic dimethyl sulfoxide reductase subunit C (anchor subunit)